jgi:hypothetical protein
MQHQVGSHFYLLSQAAAMLLQVFSAKDAAVDLVLSIDDVYSLSQATTMLLPVLSAKGAAVDSLLSIDEPHKS